MKKLRDKIVIEIGKCAWWTEFAKTSVCIILVALVYFESAKIYTGPKIVRILKRLRNTEIKAQFSANVPANTEAFAVVISDKSLIFQSDGQKMRVEY